MAQTKNLIVSKKNNFLGSFFADIAVECPSMSSILDKTVLDAADISSLAKITLKAIETKNADLANGLCDILPTQAILRVHAAVNWTDCDDFSKEVKRNIMRKVFDDLDACSEYLAAATDPAEIKKFLVEVKASAMKLPKVGKKRSRDESSSSSEDGLKTPKKTGGWPMGIVRGQYRDKNLYECSAFMLAGLIPGGDKSVAERVLSSHGIEIPKSSMDLTPTYLNLLKSKQSATRLLLASPTSTDSRPPSPASIDSSEHDEPHPEDFEHSEDEHSEDFEHSE